MLSKPLKFFQFLVFLASVFALSLVFASFRVFDADLILLSLLRFTLSVGFLFLTLFILGFFSYAEEWAKGNVKRRVRVYEKMIQQFKVIRQITENEESKI